MRPYRPPKPRGPRAGDDPVKVWDTNFRELYGYIADYFEELAKEMKEAEKQE